ncbi:hypothetical protein ABK040_003518 [Willaertia magna]
MKFWFTFYHGSLNEEDSSEFEGYKSMKLQQIDIQQIIKVKTINSQPHIIRIVDESGKVYAICNTPKTNVVASSEEMKLFETQHYVVKMYNILDGIRYKALAISSYTEHCLFLVLDTHTNRQVIFGVGNNTYRQLCQHEKISSDTDKARHVEYPRLVYDPIEYRNNDKDQVTHIGCCFSFSVCIINDIEIHLSGQNWLSGTSVGYHDWNSLLFKTKEKVRAVVCGNFHVCILLMNGNVLTGGSSYSGQTIIPNNVVLFEYVPTIFNSILGFAGSESLLLLHEEGFYHCYGNVEDYFTYENYWEEQNLHVRKVLSPMNGLTIAQLQMNRNYGAFIFKEKPNVILFKGNAYDSSGSLNQKVIELTKETNGALFSVFEYVAGPNSIIIYSNFSNLKMFEKLRQLINAKDKLSDISICLESIIY